MTDKIHAGNPDNKSYWLNQDTVKQFASMPIDRYVEKVITSIENPSEKQALDLGCGGGRHTEFLASTGFNTFACDVNSTMIMHTRKRISNLYPENELLQRVTYGAITNIPFPDESFDVLVSTGVLHQAKSMQDYIKTASEVARVVKKGAILPLHIFTNLAEDVTYKRIENEEFSVSTQEGLFMTLLPKELFIQLLADVNIVLVEDQGEKIYELETGPRSLFRGLFKKV